MDQEIGIAIFHQMSEGVVLIEVDQGRVLEVNRSFHEATGMPAEYWRGQPMDQWLDVGPSQDQFRAFLGQRDPHTHFAFKDDCHIRVPTGHVPINGRARFIVGALDTRLMLLVRDLSQHQREQRREEQRGLILKQIASGRALGEILTAIVAIVESESPQARCSILLLDKQGCRLLHGAAPHLPDFYVQAINGVAIGPQVGSCGSACFTQKRVVVEDIETHPFWAPYRELALSAGLRACWSEPILSSTGVVLGAFAVYKSEPGSPLARELEAVALSIDLASIAIEQALTLAAMRESQQMLRMVLDAIPQGVFWKDQHSRYLGCNQLVARALGFDQPEDIAGKQDTDFASLTAEQAAFFQQKDREVMDSRQPLLGIIEPASLVDGSTIWMETNKIPLLDQAGAVQGVLGTWQDITARKRAEEALRASEQKLAAIAATTPQALYVFDIVEQRTVYSNREVWRDLGYTQPQIDQLGPTFMTALLHPDDLARMPGLLSRWQTARDEQVLETEYRLRDVSGQWRWFLGRDCVYQRDEHGCVRQIIGTAQDITDRKSVEYSLQFRLCSQCLASELSAGFVNVSTSDIDQVVIFALEKTARFHGATRGAIYLFLEKQQTHTLTHEWTLKTETWEESAHFTARQKALLDHFHERLRGRDLKMVVFSSPHDYRELAFEDADSANTPFPAQAIIPLFHRDGYCGAMVIAAEGVTPIDWRPEYLELLRFMGNIILNALERKHADQALRESETRFRMLIEDLDAGVVLHDSADRIVVSNRAAAANLGLTQDQLQGLTSRDPRWRLVREDGSEFPLDEVPSAWAARTLRPVHNVVLGTVHSGTGARTWLQVCANPRLKPDGSLLHVLVTLVDITERKRIETELRESEERLACVIRHAPNVAMQLYDADGHVLLWNEASKTMFGFSGDEAVGKTLDQLIHTAEEAAAFRASLAEISRTHMPVPPTEFTYRRRDGQQGICLSSIFRIPGSGGMDWFVCMDVDITERKRAEEALRASEESFRLVVERSPLSMVLFDPRGAMVRANRAFEELWQLEINQAAKVLNALAPPPEANVQEIRPLIEAVFAGEERTFPELEVDPQHWGLPGRKRWIQPLAYAIRDGAGNVRGVVLIQQDITERKRAEQERRKLEEQIQQTQKLESLGVLAGGIAHDFNNLLTGILGYVDLALLDLPIDSPARPLITEAVNGARRAAELTKQMLAYSGKGRFVVEPLDISAVTEDIARLLHISISKKCTLRFNLFPNLPAIEADSAQIRQIIMNLIINASEAIGDRSGIIAISTGVMFCDEAYFRETFLNNKLAEGMYVYLEVADNGCGMSEDTRAKIFDPFFTTKFTGRGLGLSAVLGIVRGHRGAIKIYSELGKGTTFKVLFPASSQLPKAPLGRSARTAEWQARGVVLVVDDEETVRVLARHMLEKMGFRVLVAADGREGVEVFRAESHHIRLVLLDLTMPRLDGEEAFREMRHLAPHVRAILTSGYNEQTATTRFAGKGLAGFIQKPFRFEDLLAIVRRVLGE